MSGLTPIKFDHKDKHGKQHWLYQCFCGNRKVINRSDINSGRIKSCGCLRDEITRKLNLSHQEGYNIKEYRCWVNMKQRCLNPKRKDYKDYGGRGIKVCDRWLESYENFLDDMSRAPSPQYSIERKNNDGNYDPSNCKWGTKKEQRLNQRKKN